MHSNSLVSSLPRKRFFAVSTLKRVLHINSHSLIIFSVDDIVVESRVSQMDSGSLQMGFHHPAVGQAEVQHLAWNSDGTLLAQSIQDRNLVIIWAENRCFFSQKIDRPGALAWHPQLKELFVVSAELQIIRLSKLDSKSPDSTLVWKSTRAVSQFCLRAQGKDTFLAVSTFKPDFEPLSRARIFQGRLNWMEWHPLETAVLFRSGEDLKWCSARNPSARTVRMIAVHVRFSLALWNGEFCTTVFGRHCSIILSIELSTKKEKVLRFPCPFAGDPLISPDGRYLTLRHETEVEIWDLSPTLDWAVQQHDSHKEQRGPQVRRRILFRSLDELRVVAVAWAVDASKVGITLSDGSLRIFFDPLMGNESENENQEEDARLYEDGDSDPQESLADFRPDQIPEPISRSHAQNLEADARSYEDDSVLQECPADLPPDPIPEHISMQTCSIVETDISFHESSQPGRTCVVLRGTWRKGDTQVPVMVKRLKSGLSSQEIEAEIEALCKLPRHPNIVRFFGFYQSKEGNLCLVMEPLEFDLKTLLSQEGGLDLKAKLSILAQITEAVLFLHDRHIVHRDIHAGNVVASRSGQRYTAKLIDFAAADSSNGCASYRPPEISSLEGSNPRSKNPEAGDVWCLGLLIFRTITGTKLTSEQALRKEGYGEIKHESLRSIVKDCLLKDSTKRMPSSELLQALRRIEVEMGFELSQEEKLRVDFANFKGEREKQRKGDSQRTQKRRRLSFPLPDFLVGMVRLGDFFSNQLGLSFFLLPATQHRTCP